MIPPMAVGASSTMQGDDDDHLHSSCRALIAFRVAAGRGFKFNVQVQETEVGGESNLNDFNCQYGPELQPNLGRWYMGSATRPGLLVSLPLSHTVPAGPARPGGLLAQ